MDVPPRKRGKYSKSGCLPCKFRKKKCDERAPTCVACERNVLICSWPTPKLPDNAHMPKPRRVGKRKNSPSNETQTTNHAGTPMNPSIHMDESTQEPKTPIRSSLISLSRDHIDLICHHPLLGNTISKLLFDYYIQRIAEGCSVMPAGKNPFLVNVIPLALSNDLVMHGLLYFTGAHYPNRSLPVRNMVWTHFAQAASGLKYSLTAFQKKDEREVRADVLLLVSYFLLSAEIAGGKVTSDVVPHLQAMQVFLDHLQKTNQIDGSMYGFLVEAYTYTAILIDFSMDTYPRAWRLADAQILLSTRTSGMHLGCAGSLFVKIPAITILSNSLAQERAGWHAQGKFYDDYSVDNTSLYTSLLKDISDWRAPLQDTDTALVLFGKIYQQAILLCLQISFYQHCIVDDALAAMVQNSVSNIVDLFRLMKIDSPVNTTICWPLIIAGVCSTSAEDRIFVTQRLESMHEKMTFPSLLEARDFLQTLWSERDNTPDAMFMSPIDIQREIKRQKRTIVFV